MRNKDKRQPQGPNKYEFEGREYIVESVYNDNGLEDIASILRRMILCQAQTLKEKHNEKQNQG